MYLLRHAWYKHKRSSFTSERWNLGCHNDFLLTKQNKIKSHLTFAEGLEKIGAYDEFFQYCKIRNFRKGLIFAIFVSPLNSRKFNLAYILPLQKLKSTEYSIDRVPPLSPPLRGSLELFWFYPYPCQYKMLGHTRPWGFLFSGFL